MKIIMLFPGYGSQFVGMGKELYDESRVIQEYFEEASNCLNINYVKLCFASSDSELGKITNAYSALFLVSSSLFALLKHEGIVPHAVAGYNLGEFAALWASQGLSFPDGLYLINKLAIFYQELITNNEFTALLVKGIETGHLQALCDQVTSTGDSAHIAMHVSDQEHVIAGHARAMAAIGEQLVTMNAVQATDYPVEVGLHSPLMDPLLQQLSMYLLKVDFKDLTIPFITCVDAKEINTCAEVQARILCHMHNAVNWNRVMDCLDNYDLIIEVGPGSTLTPIVKSKYPDKLVLSVNKRSDIDELKKILGIQSPIPEIPMGVENQPSGEQDGTV